MFCPNCESAVDIEDNFCRRCGAPLTGAGLPVPVAKAYPPVPWRSVAAVMVQGAVALALTAALEMAGRALVRRALQGPLSLLRSEAARKPAKRADADYYVPVETHTERQTVVVRQVRMRRS